LFAEKLSADKTTGVQREIGAKLPNLGQYWPGFGPKNCKGWGQGKSGVEGLKRKQIPIIVQNFIAIGRRISQNEDLKEQINYRKKNRRAHN